MKKLLTLLLLTLILVGSTGCGERASSNEANSAVIENIGDSGVKNVVIGTEPIKMYDMSNNKNFRTQFKFVLDSAAHSEIKCFKSGETVTIDLGEIPSGNVTIMDVLLDTEGEQMYTDKEINHVPFVQENGKFRFTLEQHFVSALNSNTDKSNPVLRGFRISGTKGDTQFSYGFVIKTDSY